ncbi:MAG: efflux RND transporter permease subunit [bacterium]
MGDLGEARDTFAEVDLEMTFNGRPAVLVDVYRMGRESPTSVSDATYAFIERMKGSLPAGVQMDVWNDRAELYAGRLDLLKRNAIFGLVLVFLALGPSWRPGWPSG